MTSNTDRRAPEMPTKVITFDTTEGTFMSVDVSPDEEALTFDLLGDLYLLSINGGEAVPLTTGRAWDQAPRFSPGGESIYFVSDREGARNIWRVTVADGSVQQVTASAADIVGTPNWSRDGAWLLVGVADAATRMTEFILHRIDPETGKMEPLEIPDEPWIDMDDFSRHFRDPIKTYSGIQAADGQIYSDTWFDRQNGSIAVRLHRLDPQTQVRTAITPSEADYSEYKPQISHGGRLLAYFRQYEDRRTELRILNTVAEADTALIELSDADDASYRGPHDTQPNYAFTPDDRHVIFWHHGKIHRVALADGSAEVIPFHVKVVRELWQRVKPAAQTIAESGTARVVRWPSISSDGRVVVFAAIGYVWIMDVNTGESRRLTQSSDFEYMPALSPDGTSVAYISFRQLEEGYGPGRLMVASIDGGPSRELLSAVNGTYLLPNWSADGGKIALMHETMGENGAETAFGWTNASSGGFQEVASTAAGSRANLYIYARYVGFDQTGGNLLFSYPTSVTETVLAAADLDGGAARSLAIGTSEVGGITPAPDLKHLALTRHDGTVWVVRFEADDEPVEVSTSSPGARCASDGGGYYVGWHDPDEITFGFAQSIYRYELTDGDLDVLPVELAFPKPKAARPVAFQGARLITLSGGVGAGRVIEQGTIVLEGQRISALGPVGKVPIPDEALVIDAAGKTIMPGLIDSHYHRIGGLAGRASGLSAFKLPNPSFSDPSAMAYGITTAWEPAGPPNDGVPATADLQVAGRILGPRWSYAAMGVVGYPFEQLTTYAAALAAVDQYRELGVKVLKEYNTPTREQRQLLVAAARERELGIVSHLQGFDGMMTRVVDGYTGADHATIPIPFFKDVRELLRQTGYIWTPNLEITPGGIGIRSDRASYYWREVLKKRPNELERLDTIASYRPNIAEPSVPYEILRIHRVADAAANAAKSGAHIGVSAHSMPGVRLHGEMWHLWKGGLPAGDVLRAATMVNAEKLGLQEEIGSLEVGKVADVLVLNENPLEDIINTLAIEYTVQGGVLYDAATAKRADLSDLRNQDPLDGRVQAVGASSIPPVRH